MPHFGTCAGPTGSGKTRAATTFACERLTRNVKSAFIQPTIALCKQTHSDARMRFPAVSDRIKTIVSRRGSDDKIAHRITKYLNDRDQGGDLLLVTHAGFLRIPHWHRADTWHLFVDEAMEVAYHREFKLKKNRQLLLNLFDTRASCHERYAVLEARDRSRLEEALAQMEDDEIYRHFADFVWRLRHDHWNLYVDRQAFRRFQAGKSHALEVHGLLAPSIFDRFASVTFMGANLSDSVMYRYFAQEGCTFSDHTAINNNLRYRSHNNGSRLLIKYLSERKWSKTLRNRQVRGAGDQSMADDVCALYMDLCRKEAVNHSNLPPLWIGNNDIRNEEFDGERLKNVPHGMNSYMRHEVCCIFSALNPPQAHRKFLQDLCGMTEREVRRALLSQTAYQACRGILRDPDSTGTFLLIVPDRDTADDIAGYYPGCEIQKLASDIEWPKIGRPCKYESEEHRINARREQNRRSQRRVRKKSLYTGDSSDIGRTPDQVRQHLVHVLNEWAELAPDTTGAGGFARSLWLSKTDRIGQGYTTHMPTTDLIADLQRRQGIERVCKEATMLMCPTIFRGPLQLPDHLTAIGISIESSGRTKDDAVGCRGFLFDIENGEMAPEDFADVFPGLEFFAYSSWSHTTGAPRYRIGIPSTQLVRPDIHALILHTIVDRLEAAGWGDALAPGNKHGVDIGKLHEAALFYLPSKRPAGFIVHKHHSRSPLNLHEWVNLIADDLLLSPPPPAPLQMHGDGDAAWRMDVLAPMHQNGFVKWAIDYWRARGCVKGKGRTQLWLLAKHLAAAGCSVEDMRAILQKQAVFASNPGERRGEIEGLLTDPQVVAARRSTDRTG